MFSIASLSYGTKYVVTISRINLIIKQKKAHFYSGPFSIWWRRGEMNWLGNVLILK